MISATTPATATVVKAVNQFGFDLFRQLTATLEKNVVISPFSVAAALAMVYDGATGATREAMADVLRLKGLSREDINAAYAELMAGLTATGAEMQLEIANSLWMRQGYPIKPEYIERNRECFRAEIAEVEFNDTAVQRINAWVSVKTHGQISSIIQELNPLSVMVLLNAVYFKAKWGRPFDAYSTTNGAFMLLSGQRKPCIMMNKWSEPLPAFENEYAQGVRLRYRGGPASMVVILPSRELGLNNLLGHLTIDQWSGWLDLLSQRERLVMLGLPRFKTDYDVTLNDSLRTLGMGVAFNPAGADFDEICPDCPERLFIGQAKHKVFLDVNEKGTEAAATTAVDMRPGALDPEPTMMMIVDRPFFVAICDDRTGVVLFAGAIVDPGEIGEV